eukprot:3063633-Amphidinium_carterae.1
MRWLKPAVLQFCTKVNAPKCVSICSTQATRRLDKNRQLRYDPQFSALHWNDHQTMPTCSKTRHEQDHWHNRAIH